MTFRKDIQGFRALAVVLVIAYHYWPEVVPGGYVGVDIFFVLSGFLITSIILTEIEGSGRFSIGNFYYRRVKRLLPLSMFVIIVSFLFAIILSPMSVLEQFSIDALSSTFYFQNINLAIQSVDYLGGENALTPYQHFWSLSIEEQFYLAYPIIILATLLYKRNPIRLMSAWIVIILTISLILSIVSVFSYEISAYFYTRFRVWEIASGALLAVCWVRIPRTNIIFYVGGLVAIFLSAYLYDNSTKFPGYAALLPVVGSLLLLNSTASESRIAPLFFENRFVVYIGNISYGLYLWHWPVYYFLHKIDAVPLKWLPVIALTLTFFVTIVANKYVEQPGKSRVQFSLLGIKRKFDFGIVISVLQITLIVIFFFVTKFAAFWEPHKDYRVDINKYPGPNKFLQDGPVAYSRERIQPIPLFHSVKGDLPLAYEETCHLGIKDLRPKPCTINNDGSSLRVLLLGDSHAVQWLPALRSIAEVNDWYVESHTKSGCAPLLGKLQIKERFYSECYEWSDNVFNMIEDNQFDVVIYGVSRTSRVMGDTLDTRYVDLQEAIEQTLKLLEEKGERLIVLADTFRLSRDLTLCLEDDICEVEKPETVDPSIEAARKLNIAVLDLNPFICGDRCRAIEGNVVVWRDKHHITKTYSRLFGPIIYKKVLAYK